MSEEIQALDRLAEREAFEATEGRTQNQLAADALIWRADARDAVSYGEELRARICAERGLRCKLAFFVRTRKPRQRGAR